MTPAGSVLDSWPLLAWIQNEPAADAVEAMLRDARRSREPVATSVINAGEVYYQLLQRRGADTAGLFWRDALAGAFPFRVYSATNARVHRAAGIKAQFRLAYADAFAIGLAQELKCTLVTGDREIREAVATLGIELHWLG